MLKTLKLPLQPTPEQHDGLLATMHRFNAACTWIAQQAHHTRTTNKIVLQKLVYYAVRDQFGLSAQLTIRASVRIARRSYLCIGGSCGVQAEGKRSVPVPARAISVS